MSRNKRKQSAQVNEPAAVSNWGGMLLVSLALCRFLVPTEAVEQGHTLWLSFLWFGFAALLFLFRWRDFQTVQFRLSLLDFAVAAMILGHLLSGAMIFVGVGNQRSALNMMWEWAALGVFWILLKVQLQNFRTKTLFLNATVTLVVSLSVLGIWQHYYWFPQQARAYETLVDYTERVQAGERLTPDERREFQKLTDDYGTEVATLDASARMSMLSRVRDSVEPIGRFALANSFATLLIVGFFLLLTSVVSAVSQTNLRRAVVPGIVFLLVVYCLILTKSRSAWAGTITGLVLWTMLRAKRPRNSLTLPRWTIPAVMIVMTLLIGWATMTGGLDPQVISEAPKSFQYRLEYWTSTAQLLRDSPFFGAGPGNFRQQYLKYKLPGASEEIIDPHNLFLGIWAGGGILALAGLLIFISALMKNGLRSAASSDAKNPVPDLTIRELLTSQILPIATVLGVLFLFEGSFEVVLLGVGAVATVFALFFVNGSHQQEPSPAILLAAALAILIHLLAASGIEMPAIVMLLFVLAFLVEEDDQPALLTLTLNKRGMLAATVVLTVVALACVKTGLVPVRLAAISIQAGNYRLVSEGNTQRAELDFKEAVLADPLSPEPPLQMAMLKYRLWENSKRRRSDLFDAAVTELEKSIHLDPTAAARFRLLGNIWDRRFEQTQNPEHGQQAVNAYRQAVTLYPNFAATQAEYAIALDRIGNDATKAARTARELDDLNHVNQHTDKYLSKELRAKIEAITNQKRSRPITIHR